jgi:microcystin degradation protein MlrC
MIRLAVLGLSHEANSFATHLVDTEVFEAAGVLRGPEIVAVHQGGTSTISGFLTIGERPGVEVVPLVMTTLIPSGKITAEALRIRTDELVNALAAGGPFDGVLAALHGAAVAEDRLDVDGYLLRRFRELVGPDVRIGASLDLHANISEQMCAHVDALNTYRTNPHVDAREVAAEMADLIVRAVRGEVRLTQAYQPIPAAINILCQNTDDPPMSDIMADLRATMARPGVLSATVAEGYPYADVPEMGMSVVVVTDGDPDGATRHARALAERVWARRGAFDVRAPSAAEALRAVAREPGGPVLLLDVGDNIGAGSPGDSVVLLNAARATGLAGLLAIIADPVAVAICDRAGVGARVGLSIGAKTDPETGPPVEASATVLALHDGIYQATEPVHAGMSAFDAGRSAAVRLESGQTVILTSKVVMPLTTAQLTTLGLAPTDFTAIVAKGVHSPLAGYLPHVTGMIRVDTPGVTSADLSRFSYVNRRRPMFPFESRAALSPRESEA